MTNLSPIQEAQRRSRQYWFEDGFQLLLIGTLFLLFAFFILYPRHHSYSLVSVVLSFSVLGLYFLVALRQRQILEWLKARITYPRTGYVSPPYSTEETHLPIVLTPLSAVGADANPSEDAARSDTRRKRQVWLASVLTLVAIVPIMFVRTSWTYSATGVLMAAVLWVGSHHERRLSWILLAGFPLVGFWMSMFLSSGIKAPERVANFLASAGFLFFLDGAVSLFRYLFRHPRLKSTEP
jgi:hypothetical protein